MLLVYCPDFVHTCIWTFFQIDLVMAEPNFSMNLLPWQNLLFWYCLKHISASRGITAQTKVGILVLPKVLPRFLTPKFF